MAIEQRTRPAAALPTAAVRGRRGRLTGGGTEGNELLTAATGAVLIVMLAVLGVTIVRVHQLIWLHLFVGALLIGPLALKLASTGYRFARYYTRNAIYRLKGPPEAFLRGIAPVVVLSTLVVFASGFALLFEGPSSRDTWLPVHKVSFIVWIAFTALHVLGHLAKLPAALRADYGGLRVSGDVTGRSGRMIALAGAIVAGAVLAVLLVPEFAPWVHDAAQLRGQG